MSELVLGIGCDRGTALETLERAVLDALASVGQQPDQVRKLATIDKKQDEDCMRQLSDKYGWPLVFYSAGQLSTVEVPSPSEVVLKYMGTPSVSEAAAILAGQTDQSDLLLEKYKYRGADDKNATVSIVRMKKNIMSGKIYLVGFGPGAEQHMTFKAKQAIAESDVVIGYSTYIKLVKDLLDGKEVVKKGMTEEIDRCIEAYEQAKQGKTVALISSGDIGVYGMAGPTYEVLLQSGWRPGSEIEVEIVPGATALSACASLVGAPLTHDFCSISLSDLLTPWPVIAKRLEAAASADFVVALYNPKSGRRTQQIVEAQKIMLRYRDPETPVAIVKSAYRRRQSIQLVKLHEMADCEIGMLTTVLIGNSSTFVQDGLMITPRGYANKYESLSGAAKQGEKAGRSLTMGLEGWKACLREYLAQQDVTLEQAAEYFSVPVGDVLSTIAETGEAGVWRAASVPADKIDALIQTTRHWGRLRGIVRAEGGAVAELFLQGDDFKTRGEWLNIENDAFHLHVNRGKIVSAWLASREGKSYGAHFVDIHGRLVFRLLLVKQDGQFSTETLNAYARSWRDRVEA